MEVALSETPTRRLDADLSHGSIVPPNTSVTRNVSCSEYIFLRHHQPLIVDQECPHPHPSDETARYGNILETCVGGKSRRSQLRNANKT